MSETIVKDWGEDYKTTAEFCSQISSMFLTSSSIVKK